MQQSTDSESEPWEGVPFFFALHYKATKTRFLIQSGPSLNASGFRKWEETELELEK